MGKPGIAPGIAARIAGWVVACGVALAAVGIVSTPVVGQQQRDFAPVPMVTAIECARDGAQDLVVAVVGLVPSAGWSEPRLEPHAALPSDDGFWELDFVALPPAGRAAQVLREIAAVDRIEQFRAAEIRGFRVFGVGEGVQEISLARCIAASAPRALNPR
jgi:hypothetical protein